MKTDVEFESFFFCCRAIVRWTESVLREWKLMCTATNDVDVNGSVVNVVSFSLSLSLSLSVCVCVCVWFVCYMKPELHLVRHVTRGAENDGHVNGEPSKLQGTNLQDMKLQDMKGK